MTPQQSDNLTQQYCDYAIQQIEEQGIYPTPGIAKATDGSLSIYAMALDGNGIVKAMLSKARDRDTVEQIFALDTYTKDGQGTTLDSCLVIFHMQRGEPTQIGVLEYSWNDGEPITKPVNWGNEFWTTTYKRLAEDLTKLFS